MDMNKEQNASSVSNFNLLSWIGTKMANVMDSFMDSVSNTSFAQNVEREAEEQARKEILEGMTLVKVCDLIAGDTVFVFGKKYSFKHALLHNSAELKKAGIYELIDHTGKIFCTTHKETEIYRAIKETPETGDIVSFHGGNKTEYGVLVNTFPSPDGKWTDAHVAFYGNSFPNSEKPYILRYALESLHKV